MCTVDFPITFNFCNASLFLVSIIILTLICMINIATLLHKIGRWVPSKGNTYLIRQNDFSST